MATFIDPTGFRKMKVKEKDINVLLIGETGLGKSTLINSIVNYLQYESFDEAVESGVKHVIPTTIYFNEHDSLGKLISKKVSIGEDSNEDGSVTSSATQSCRSYVIPSNRVTKSRLRIIDTPGIGDTRGIFQDKANLEDIFSYIGKISKLHAICLLLRPNESRLTATFVYCVNQLLARLEKSASENIIFVFTNARNSRFKPGNTITALKELIESIANSPSKVLIPFTSENTFYFDNEAFRYLVALKGDIKLSDKSGYRESWEKSWSECERLVRSAVGEVPHEVSKSVSVNRARGAISELTKPLVYVSERIEDDLRLLCEHQKQIDVHTTLLEDLKKRLFLRVVNVERVECPEPRTVCVKCCESIVINEKELSHYETACHNPCYLSEAQKNVIGDPGLLRCIVMDEMGKCKYCKCSFQFHQLVYYETRRKDEYIEDSEVKTQIEDQKSAIKAVKDNIQMVKIRKNEFEQEKRVIIRAMAQFAYFLRTNAISPFNDSYKNYVNIAIKREEDRGPECNQIMLASLRDLLMQYEEERTLLEEAQKTEKDQKDLGTITVETVKTKIKKLYSLKHTGTKIRSLHEKQSGEYSELTNTEMCVPELQLKPKTVKKGVEKDVHNQEEDNQNRNQGSNRNHNRGNPNRDVNQNQGNYNMGYPNRQSPNIPNLMNRFPNVQAPSPNIPNLMNRFPNVQAPSPNIPNLMNRFPNVQAPSPNIPNLMNRFPNVQAPSPNIPNLMNRFPNVQAPSPNIPNLMNRFPNVQAPSPNIPNLMNRFPNVQAPSPNIPNLMNRFPNVQAQSPNIPNLMNRFPNVQAPPNPNNPFYLNQNINDWIDYWQSNSQPRQQQRSSSETTFNKSNHTKYNKRIDQNINRQSNNQPRQQQTSSIKTTFNESNPSNVDVNNAYDQLYGNKGSRSSSATRSSSRTKLYSSDSESDSKQKVYNKKSHKRNNLYDEKNDSDLYSDYQNDGSTNLPKSFKNLFKN